METITYRPDSKRARILIGEKGRAKKLRYGDEVNRGDIPDDVFDYLKSRPDFGADLEEYKKTRGDQGAQAKLSQIAPILSAEHIDLDIEDGE